MATAEGYISIVNWAGSKGFQHYDPSKRGVPPWIKNYTRLMDDDDYMDLTEHCALMLHRLWLVYAKSACRLPADTRKLSQRLGMRVTKQNLESLTKAGFIHIVASKSLANGYQAASKALALAHADARSAETETEIEESFSKSKAVDKGPIESDEPEWAELDEPRPQDFHIPDILREMPA